MIERTLTPPLEVVVCPEFFWPSQLARTGGCMLRLIAAGPGIPGILETGPRAAFGRVHHRLLEEFARTTVGESQLEEKAKELLGSLIASEDESLAAAGWSKQWVPLRSTVSALEFMQFEHHVIAQAVRRARLSRRSRHPLEVVIGRDHQRPEAIGEHGSWPEVALRSATLRIAGRIDFLERRPGKTTVVREYKSGRCTDPAGELLQHVVRQVRLYGLLVLDRWKGDEVELIVEAAREFVVPFGSSQIAETKQWLENLLRALPSGKVLEADRLAVPGAACADCLLRPRCARYLNDAPARWRSPLGEAPLPLDTWGRLTLVEKARTGNLVAVLNDAAGRKVKVFGILPEHLSVLTRSIGEDIFFFSLEAQRYKLNAAEHHHPLNFHEVPATRSDHRAWTAMMMLHM